MPLPKTITTNELRNEPGAVGVKDNYQDHTDPKYIGPGTWNVIHRRAFNARTPDQQRQFIDLMNEICHGFPCSVCQTHCTEYINTHPMEEYLNITIEIDGQSIPLGIFIWTWKFHNAVNTRIRKPLMSWDTAYNLYSEKESLVCSKKCLEAENFPPDGSENVPVTTPTNSNGVVTTPLAEKAPFKPPMASTVTTAYKLPQIIPTTGLSTFSMNPPRTVQGTF